MRGRGKGGQRHQKPLSEAQQVAIAAQVLQVMIVRHRAAGDSFKRANDDDAAQAEYRHAEDLDKAQQILRQNRLLPPSQVHDMARRVS